MKVLLVMSAPEMFLCNDRAGYLRHGPLCVLHSGYRMAFGTDHCLIVTSNETTYNTLFEKKKVFRPCLFSRFFHLYYVA